MADEEEFPVDDNYGLIDQPEQADVVLEGVVTTGDEDGPIDESNPEPPMVEPVTPVDSWAEVDPDYEELLDEDAEVEDAPDEDIPSGAPDTTGDDATPFEGVAWAFYEIEGRSFDRDGAWQQLAREEFTGALDARIDGLPAGERWEFRVRLVDHDGIASAWSETTLDQLPVDETPPPAPTAPIVDENNGFITYGWDGNLVAPTPADMSHTLAYVRQLHPAGSPEGPAGDPQLLTRFMQQGTQSTGALVSDVPHEFWLVAVDTTGNGSQWSEVVTATPSEPVDAQRIRDELDTINGPDGRLPALEQSLSMGLDEVYRDLASKASVTSEIQQAAQDQAAAAQAEYDRLQGLAEDAQAKADAVESDQEATAEEVATARREAQDAQESADAAQTAASAAQEQAGEAQTTADQALDSANAKSRIYSSTSAPTGTASDGDLWYRWSSTATDRRLLGIWVRESGAWRSMGTLDTTLIPLLDIGAGTFGDLSGDRLAAQSVTAKHVRLGAYEDMVPDPKFTTEWWDGNPQGFKGQSTDKGPDALYITSSRIQNAGGQIDISTPYYDAIPGAQYAVTFDAARLGANQNARDNFRVWVRVVNEFGSYVTQALSVNNYTSTNAWGERSYTFTIPEMENARGWQVQWRFNAVDGGAVWVANPSMRRRLGATMYVDGSVKAVTLDAVDIAADVGRMNQLWVGFAGIAEAQIDELLGNTARFKEINAPLIQSHTDPDTGWKLRPDGTAMMREADVRGRFQAGTGGNRVEIDQGDVTYFSPVDGANRTLTDVPYLRFSTPDGAGGTTEPLIAAKPTGGLVLGSGRNSPEFGRSVVEIDGHLNALGADFTSHVNTTSVYASIGITGIGSNPTQLGGIVADGARTRIQGRTADSHHARDMYVRGSSGTFMLPNDNSIHRVNFTYGQPVPQGDRMPFVTCSTQLGDNTNGRLATVGVGNISEAGFQGVAVNAGGGSQVSYILLYNAIWR